MVIKETIMFFSVKTPMKIGNKTYRTCICYNLTETVKPAVEKLVAQGKATIYNEQKFFLPPLIWHLLHQIFLH